MVKWSRFLVTKIGHQIALLSAKLKGAKRITIDLWPSHLQIRSSWLFCSIWSLFDNWMMKRRRRRKKTHRPAAGFAAGKKLICNAPLRTPNRVTFIHTIIFPEDFGKLANSNMWFSVFILKPQIATAATDRCVAWGPWLVSFDGEAVCVYNICVSHKKLS